MTKYRVSALLVLLATALALSADAAIIKCNFTYVAQTGPSYVDIMEPQLWEGGMAPSPSDDAIIDFSLIQPLPGQIFFLRLSNSVQAPDPNRASFNSLYINVPLSPVQSSTFKLDFYSLARVTVAQNLTMAGSGLTLSLSETIASNVILSNIGTYRLMGHLRVSGDISAMNTTLSTDRSAFIISARSFVLDQSRLHTQFSLQLQLLKSTQSSIRIQTSHPSIADFDIQGGELSVEGYDSFSNFHSLFAQNVTVSFLASFETTPGSSIVFKNCSGVLRPDFSSYSSTPGIIFDGGAISLRVESGMITKNVTLSLRNNATVRLEHVSDYSPALFVAIDVSSNSTVSVSSRYYSMAFTRFSGSITYNDDTGFLYLPTPDSSLSVSGNVVLRNTRLLYDSSESSYYYNARTLVIGGKSLQGQLAPQFLFRHRGYRYYQSMYTLDYQTAGVYMTVLYQEWPSIGWGVFPIILVVSVIMVALLLLFSTMCSRRAGNMEDTDWLGRPNFRQYSAVGSASSYSSTA